MGGGGSGVSGSYPRLTSPRGDVVQGDYSGSLCGRLYTVMHGRNLVGDGGGNMSPPLHFFNQGGGDIPYCIPPSLTNNENYML